MKELLYKGPSFIPVGIYMVNADRQTSLESPNNIIPFNYEGLVLKESCWIDGVPYFTYRAIGEFLEYEDPMRQINHLIKRNPYILQFRTVVKLTTVEGGRTVSNLTTVEGSRTGVNLTPVERDRSVTRDLYVVHPIGMQCIFFESHQPKAIQYKVAVAKLVWAMMNGELKPSKLSQRGDLISSARQILSLPEGRKRRGLIIDLAEREGCTLQNIYRQIVMVSGERLKTKKGTPRKPRSEKGTTKYPGEKEKVLSFISEHPEYLIKSNQHKTFFKKDMKKMLGLSASESRICAWIREFESTIKIKNQAGKNIYFLQSKII